MKINSKKKVFWVVFLSLIAIVGVVFGYYLSGVISYQNKVKNTIIAEVDIAEIPDGVYVGEYDVGFIYAKVSVSVFGGKITELDIIEHRHEHGEAAEKIIDDILERQKIDVDAVTGATNSSTVIKKAVENAVLGYN
ncbi:MAG: FMN-binding protein [Oscillospiraceae bacterium]|nr:FMN-binding protein [Oscillospiraceae bacterium]